MRITTIALLTTVAGLLAACSPGPGSAEWCKGVMNGTIKATADEMQANSDKCQEVLMKEVMGAIGGTGQ